MPPTRRSNALYVYHNCLRQKPYSFPCPFCKITIKPKDYEKHCRLHDLNSNICCVWCYGSEQWISGKKSVHGKHLHECFKRFIAVHRTPRHPATATIASTLNTAITIHPPPISNTAITITTNHSTHSAATHTTDIAITMDTINTTASPPANHAMPNVPPAMDTTHAAPSFRATLPKLLPMQILCQAQCFFQHSSNFIQYLPEALTPLYPLERMEPPPIPFQDASLQLATSYVQHYLTTRDRFDWIHIMVKAISYPSFVRAMHEDEGLTRTLEFSCWCDGGKYPQPKHRQHRHMIIVSIRGHFLRDVWPHVTVAPEERPCLLFPCKGMKRVLSPLHLVNTLGYLSQRRSRCQFTIDSKKGLRQNKHFYIFKSLPIEYKKALVTQWDQGVYELLYQEKFQNVSIERVIQHPMIQVERQWKQKIGDFYHLERGLVLPIEKRFAPTPDPTPHVMHLMNGRKLYFTPDPENESLDENAWLQKQARGGHCFYENIAEEFWTPRPRDQKVFNVVMEKVQRIAHLEHELLHSQEYSDRLKKFYTKSEKQQQAEIGRLEREVERLKRNPGQDP